MNDYIKLQIIKNKANKQINLNPRKSKIPKELRDKFDCSKFLNVRAEDMYFE